MSANPKYNIVDGFADPKALEQKPTRNGYGDGLVELGKTNPNVVVLCADLTYIHHDV